MGVTSVTALVRTMASVLVQGNSAPVQVGKIFCLGHNYEAHTREMAATTSATPVIFLKPPTALVASGGTVVIPSFSSNCHHEVEMVVLIGKKGKKIAAEEALDFVAGYGVGLDMTLRDVQAAAKKEGLPWAVAKGFDTSAPVSAFVPRTSIADPHTLSLSLAVNGVIRQKSNTAAMVFRVERIVAYLSTVFTLEEGDLIFTGTPEGVGRVVSGDRLHAELESVGTLDVGVISE